MDYFAYLTLNSLRYCNTFSLFSFSRCGYRIFCFYPPTLVKAEYGWQKLGCCYVKKRDRLKFQRKNGDFVFPRYFADPVSYLCACIYTYNPSAKISASTLGEHSWPQ